MVLRLFCSENTVYSGLILDKLSIIFVTGTRAAKKKPSGSQPTILSMFVKSGNSSKCNGTNNNSSSREKSSIDDHAASNNNSPDVKAENIAKEVKLEPDLKRKCEDISDATTQVDLANGELKSCQPIDKKIKIEEDAKEMEMLVLHFSFFCTVYYNSHSLNF